MCSETETEFNSAMLTWDPETLKQVVDGQLSVVSRRLSFVGGCIR
jgi:hypothetical protein